MSQGRDDTGRYEQTVTDQDILKVFDYEGDPVLSASEVADGLRRFGIRITPEGVRQRLNRMHEEELVDRKEFGAKAVGYWALVAPDLSRETQDRVETRKLDDDIDDWAEL